MRNLLLVPILSLAFVAGCANYPIEQAKHDLGVVTAVRVEAQAQYDAAKTPEQKASALKRLNEAKKAESLVSGVIKTYEDGVIAPEVRDTLMGIPYGKEVLLGLSGIAYLFADRRKRQAQDAAEKERAEKEAKELALRQTVTAIEVSGEKTDALKTALATHQDEATKETVAAIRATIPTPPVAVEPSMAEVVNK